MPLTLVVFPYELENSIKDFEFKMPLNLESGNKVIKKTNSFKGR